tara:strand:- start:12435 stop:14168 length:1734 start_codon:yes stop_codon:yes gene_type:complete
MQPNSYIIAPGIDATRAIENPNIPLSSPDVWQEVFGSTNTQSGISINPASSLTIAPVFQAINLISGDVAKLPINVYKRMPELGVRGRDVDDNHPAQRLIKYRPNPEMSAFKFWRRIMTHSLLWSNAYCIINRDSSGNPTELLPLLPDRTTPQRTKDGQLFYVSEIDGELQGFAASNILHIEQISITGEADCQLLYKAREAFALSLAAEQFASKYFVNGGRIGGILEMPPGMTKQGADNLESGFRKTYESIDNSFRSVILRDGAKFHQAQFTPEQTQMTAARDQQVKEVARWFNIPPHKLGDDSKASYNSLEQENRAYLQGCLSHWLKTVEAECYLKLLSPLEQESNSHFVEFNTAALVQADISTQYTIYRTGIEAGILSPDEVRAMQNLNPRPDGLGSKYLRPLNMEYAEQEPEDEEPVVDQVEAEEPVEEELDEERCADDCPCQLTTPAMELLDKEIERFTGYLTRKVNREFSKKGHERFMLWIEINSDEEKPILRDSISQISTMICTLNGWNRSDFIDAIVEPLFYDLFIDVVRVVDDSRIDDPKKTLKEVTNSFASEVTQLYRDKLKAKGFNNA